MARQPDHPRSCGANSYKPRTMSSASGSSPLVRGQLGFERGLPAFGRIIPARAGPTTVDLLDARGKADHPRSCGANNGSMNSGVKSSGSSPLVRGQPAAVFGQIVGDRSIPARAGPTRAKSARIPIPSDHPRSCGANRFVRASFFYHSRIIPARAGPTYRSRPSSPRPSDHPRSCGANHLQRFRLLCALGSSPLVRGQRTGQSAFQRCVRIIPARAGPTVTQVDMDGVWPDHPRSCGANPMALVMRPGKPGSSPLVRGQRRR